LWLAALETYLHHTLTSTIYQFLEINNLHALLLQLMRHIQSLGILLGVARAAAAAQGQQLELLRKESLEGAHSPTSSLTNSDCTQNSVIIK
jgi:hypothetical protein